MALIERELDTASSGRFDGLLGIVVEMILLEAATDGGSAESDKVHAKCRGQGRDRDRTWVGRGKDTGRTWRTGDVKGY